MTEMNKSELSIDQLLGDTAPDNMSSSTVVGKIDMDTAVEYNISDLREYTGKQDPVQKNIDELLGKVDTAIDERIQRDEDFITGKMSEMEERELDEEIESSNGSHNMVEHFPSYDEDDDELFEDLRSDTQQDKKEEEQLEAIKTTIKERIKPVADAVDLSLFTISKKHVSVLKTLPAADSSKHVADWALIANKKAISMSEFTGYEIQKLNPGSSTRNRYNTYREIYNNIYEHVVDDNKPPFDIWLKGISFYDIPHLYFAIYKACFEGTNSIPYACTNKDCNHVFMGDYTIEDMVKYKDEAAKQMVANILSYNTNSENAEEYDSELVQVSDNYAITFREPTVWNIIFENAVLDEGFTDKYSDFLAIMSYIDEVYFINKTNLQLEPIQVDVDLNNVLKTVKSRVVRYSRVLKTLNSDQFQFLSSCIKKINDKYEGVQYKLPEATCPKCGSVIKEQVMDPDQLLFTRHQLAAIANI